MRICHIVEAADGGVGQVIIDLARYGAAAGDDVTVIYGKSRAAPHFLQALSPLLGPKLIPVSMRRDVGLHDIPDAWNLYQCLRRAGPFDIIHAHSSKAGALARLTGILFPRTAKIYSPHAFVTLDPHASGLYKVFEKILSRFGGAIVVLSKVEREHALDDLRIDRQKIAVIPNGIRLDYPADRSNARRIMGYGEDIFLAGFVGRFVPQKNLLRLLDAFGLAAKTEPALRLALIGDGALRTEIHAKLVAQNLTDKVRYFSGYTGRDLMPGLDCLFCASDYEGFPLVFLEALAAGVPIVTTPVGGAHETVIDGETGFIAADFSAKNLAEALRRLTALDPSQRTQMAHSARRHARNFSLERVGGHMQSLYAMLLAKSRS